MGFPTIRGTGFGVPTIGTIVYWGLYWGTPIFGNYHVSHDLNSLKGYIGDYLGSYDGLL